MEIIEGANFRQIENWKSDVWKSVEFYNNWFINFAPQAFLTARKGSIDKVLLAFEKTDNLREITVDNILGTPQIVEVLRMVTAPPLAQDRLVGLSHTKKSILKALESGRVPGNNGLDSGIRNSIDSIGKVIESMLDKELFPWLISSKITPQMRKRCAAIVADRLTGVLSDPIIRNAQENRQLTAISDYLNSKGYSFVSRVDSFENMSPMTYSFHVNVPIVVGETKKVKMPIDVVVRTHRPGKYPLFIECKSAGDFTNTNKRRKEEAVKMKQLKDTYGDNIKFCLFLCGYFDAGYLGYEAAEGIDWVWEHRISDFEKIGV